MKQIINFGVFNAMTQSTWYKAKRFVTLDMWHGEEEKYLATGFYNKSKLVRTEHETT